MGGSQGKRDNSALKVLAKPLVYPAGFQYAFSSVHRLTGAPVGWRQGERDYRALKGNTGPLVYPAGFLYAFSALHWLTGGGQVQAGQFLFAGMYLATLAVVLWLYVKAKARTCPATRQ